ncbi:GNAT family N-acetyltransferase [Ferruginibacter sp.]|uniref:GNAT family N-acetyltransferase n=1 Tax=Ferruginibacter sp. TaxID=1940288 RepID=UPI002658BDEE|nr:GNAT family N-acetyltransferase [Ferruginibacter sp.]
MALKQIDHGSNAYHQMVQLRMEILRKPLGLSFTKEELDNEKNDILIAAFDEDEILGCCILTKIDKTHIRLRQMAVQKNLQAKGIGESIISFAENIARDNGYKILTMHARDSATGFYEKFGYIIKGEQFEEVKTLHHVMEKILV